MSEEWKALGACSGLDPTLFYVGRGDTDTEAKAVCATCPVQAECLAYALSNRETFGVWGGKSERQREKLRSAMGPTSWLLRCHACSNVFDSMSPRRQFCADCARSRHVEQTRRWRQEAG